MVGPAVSMTLEMTGFTASAPSAWASSASARPGTSSAASSAKVPTARTPRSNAHKSQRRPMAQRCSAPLAFASQKQCWAGGGGPNSRGQPRTQRCAAPLLECCRAPAGSRFHKRELMARTTPLVVAVRSFLVSPLRSRKCLSAPACSSPTVCVPCIMQVNCLDNVPPAKLRALEGIARFKGVGTGWGGGDLRLLETVSSQATG